MLSKGKTGGFIFGVAPDEDDHVWLCDAGKQSVCGMDAEIGTILGLSVTLWVEG